MIKRKKIGVKKKSKTPKGRKLIFNPRTARFMEALYHTAIKFENFNDFSEYYWHGLGLGTYWIPADSSSYEITSAAEREYARQGRVIAYISPQYIDSAYVAEIDISNLDPFNDIEEDSKENTNSIKIARPDAIIVNYVYPTKKGIEVWKYNIRYLPRTQYELKEFWKFSQERFKKEQEKGRKRKTRRRFKLQVEKKKKIKEQEEQEY